MFSDLNISIIFRVEVTRRLEMVCWKCRRPFVKQAWIFRNRFKLRIEGWLARFPMFDWLGGRTSEMSAVDLLLAAPQGIDIGEMLASAPLMDEPNKSTALHYILQLRELYTISL